MFIPALQTALAPCLLRSALGRRAANASQLQILGVRHGFNASFTHYFRTDSCLCLLSSLREFLRVDGQGSSDRLSLGLECKWDNKETPDGWTGCDVCRVSPSAGPSRNFSSENLRDHRHDRREEWSFTLLKGAGLASS